MEASLEQQGYVAAAVAFAHELPECLDKHMKCSEFFGGEIQSSVPIRRVERWRDHRAVQAFQEVDYVAGDIARNIRLQVRSQHCQCCRVVIVSEPIQNERSVNLR